MAQMFTEAGGTVGGHLAGRVLNEVDEIRHYPDKYSKSEEERLDALKRRHNKWFAYIPDSWALDPEKKTPQRILMEGTWEKHWKTQLRAKKITPLRGDVEDMLRVISDYLDERRTRIWRYVNLNGIKKGDVEEQFFTHMMCWLKDTLDGSVDEMLEEKIIKYRDYLYDVIMSTDIFPLKFIHDKSGSKGIIDKLHGMLEGTINEAKKIQSEQFPLTKFEEISTVTIAMIQHFLRGFSYFSPMLRGLEALKVPNLLNVVSMSDTRFSRLFLIFAKNFYNDDQDILSELGEVKSEREIDAFYLEKFSSCMDDKTKSIGLQKSIPTELVDAVPQIFQSAYNLVKAMKLIKEASSTLSEQGAIQLFCNVEGRSYFEFLLNDFKSTKNVFVSKMLAFDARSKNHSIKELGRTGADASKKSEVGQYGRFQDSFSDIQSDNAALDSHLGDAIKQIQHFSRKTPQEAEDRRDHLYSMIRERMREKNQHDLADSLEQISSERIEKSKINQPVQPICGQRPLVEKIDISDHVAPENCNGNLLISRELDLRQKISEALNKVSKSYDRGFFAKYFGSSIAKSFAGEFIEILENSSNFPLRFFYVLLGDFIKSVEYANEESKNKYASESFYVISCKLYFLLTDRKYVYVVFPEDNVEAMKNKLSEVMTKNKKLEDDIECKSNVINDQKRQIQSQAESMNDNRRVIDELNDAIKSAGSEVSQLELSVCAKNIRISDLENIISQQAIEIGQLKKDSDSQKKTLDDLLEKQEKMPETIAEYVAKAMKKFQEEGDVQRRHGM
jgi:hypothetical protein